MTSRFGTQRSETQRQPVLIAGRKALTKRLQRLGIVISTVALVVASAVVAMMMLTSRPPSSVLAAQSLAGSSGMPGMDHGSGDMPGMNTDPTPEPGSGDVPETNPEHGSGDMPGMSPAHGDTEKTAEDRPLAPVLGTFGGGTSAVMLTAGLLRRRDRARGNAKEATHAALGTQS